MTRSTMPSPNKPLMVMLGVLLLICLPMAAMSAPGDGEVAEPASGSTTEGALIDLGENGTANEGDGPAQQMSLFALIDKGGVVGYLIMLVSVVALALIIDYMVTIRLSRILPPADLARLRTMIDQRQFDNLAQLEGDQNSFLTRVTSAGLREVNLGYDAMIKAMEDTSEALAAGIARKTEHLNVIGALSPMLGLLGTVLGMLQVFNEIAMTPGAIEPRQLAEGIFQALVTTCLGLIVAIPALYSYAIFRNRVDEFTGEAALAAERLVAPFKVANGGSGSAINDSAA